jgi:hypothetical protein
MKNILLILLVFFTASCITNVNDQAMNGVNFDGTGYRPVYATESEVKNVSTKEAMPLKDPGKIYLFDSFLFINEKGKGIHIIDNKDPKSPENLSFISIPANYDIAVKGQWLYADNATDLLVFDLSDPGQPKMAKRIANAVTNTNYPPFQNIYFECVNAKSGIVIGWEKVSMQTRPDCYR